MPPEPGLNLGSRALPLLVDSEDGDDSKTLPKIEGARTQSHLVGLPTIASLGLPPPRTPRNIGVHASTSAARLRNPSSQTDPRSANNANPARDAFNEARAALHKLHLIDPRGTAVLAKSHPEYQTLTQEIDSLQARLQNQIQITKQSEAQLARLIQENQMLIREGGRMVAARQDDLARHNQRVEASEKVHNAAAANAIEAQPVLYTEVGRFHETTSELQNKIHELQTKLKSEVKLRLLAEDALLALRKHEQT